MGVKSRTKDARHALFVEAYLANGQNATAAYLTAGYKPKKRTSAGVEGCKLLKIPHISKQIEDRLADRVARMKLASEEVLIDLAYGVRFDPALMFAADGSILPVKDMPPEIRRELESIEIQELGAPGDLLVGRTHKVKWSSKVARREQAMKHFGLFEKDNAQKPAMLPPVIQVIGVKGQ